MDLFIKTNKFRIILKIIILCSILKNKKSKIKKLILIKFILLKLKILKIKFELIS